MVGVTLVVQQVAVQDILVDKQAAPTLMLEEASKEKPKSELRKRAQESQLSQIDFLDTVVKSDLKSILLAENLAEVFDAFEDVDPYTPPKAAPSKSNLIRGTLSAVFTGSGSPGSGAAPNNPPASPPLPSPSSPDGAGARAPASGGPLGFSNLSDKDKSGEASPKSQDSKEQTEALTLTSTNEDNPQPLDLSEDDSLEGATDDLIEADNSGDEDQGQQGQEDEDDIETFLRLGGVVLYEDGQLKQLINDQETLLLDTTKSYSIVVEADEDFGSVEFILGNLDTGEELHQAQENQLPFALNGDARNGELLTAYDFEEGQMQLDLKAFDQNGRGGDIIDVRTLRFTIEFQTN